MGTNKNSGHYNGEIHDLQVKVKMNYKFWINGFWP